MRHLTRPFLLCLLALSAASCTPANKSACQGEPRDGLIVPALF